VGAPQKIARPYGERYLRSTFHDRRFPALCLGRVPASAFLRCGRQYTRVFIDEVSLLPGRKALKPAENKQAGRFKDP
jgi:hypothetical protein